MSLRRDPTRNDIVVSGNPRGHFIEGIIEGTPKPGTLMQIKAGTGPDDRGRLTWQAKQGGSDGDRGIVAVLREDHFQGKTKDDAYVNGSPGFLYIPLPGDELQVLAANITGTGSGTDDAFAVGDKLIIKEGTGKVIKTAGTPEMEPFVVMEPVSTLYEDTHVLVMYTGN